MPLQVEIMLIFLSHHSWSAIADTTGQTDEEVQERRAATAAHRLIVALREDRKWRVKLGTSRVDALGNRNPSGIHVGTRSRSHVPRRR